MRIIAVSLFLALAACASPGGSGEAVVRPGAVDAMLRSMVEEGRVVGATALIYEDGEEAYAGSYGMADREAGRPMARDTVFQIYSMTKPVTGVALMTLYEDGLFDLDDPITDYVPEFSALKVYEAEDAEGEPVLVAPKRMPTVRDFMMHTAGLVGDEDDSFIGRMNRELSPYDPLTKDLEGLADAVAQVPLGYHPGERWYYSSAMDIQALMVERLSGKPFAQYVEEQILAPLGMADTGYRLSEEDRRRFATIYRRGEDGAQIRVEDPVVEAMLAGEAKLTPGSWGLVSTADDYMRFARMLQNGGALDGVRILEPGTVELMGTNYLPAEVTERHFLPSKGSPGTMGFGLNMAVRTGPPASPEENRGAVGEFFWDGYASTLFWVDPKNDITAVFLVQQLPFDGSLHHDFREAVYAPKKGAD